MLREHAYQTASLQAIRGLAGEIWPSLRGAGWVTVLFLLTPLPGLLRGDPPDVKPAQDGAPAPHLFEFSCEFRVPVGRGRMDGLMASHGSQRRVAIYWVEPGLFRESTTFLRYGDFLFSREAVRYWIYGMSKPVTLPWSEAEDASLLPAQKSLVSVVRSSLAIASRARSQVDEVRPPLELAKFFRESRDRREYVQEDSPTAEISEDPSPSQTVEVRALNSLPYGRTYSKGTHAEGTVVWTEKRALNADPVVTLTIKRVAREDPPHCGSPFDARTLGQWVLVPEPYRTYWSFDQAYSQLRTSSDARIHSRELYEKIGTWMSADKAPSCVSCALEHLRFKTALLTDDRDPVRASAQMLVARLCADGSVGVFPSLLELAAVGGEIEERYPRQACDWLRPLVGQMVGHWGQGVAGVLDEVMANVAPNKWFLFGELLLEEIRKQRLVKEDVLNAQAAKLQVIRTAQDRALSDPCEPSATVRQYLTRLDADPPGDAIDMNDVRRILERGLTRYYRGALSATEPQLVENVLHSIRLIVGEGPFRGDPARLAQSVEHLSGLHAGVNKAAQPIAPVLATFLALSFCDTSTSEDRELLFSQFRAECAELRAQINAMLSDRGLSALVTPDDVEDVSGLYERLFRKYIDDPLWPAFRFPWTTNEQTRLDGKLKLRLMQLAPLLDEMSAKVKYGGSSPELKKKTVFEISRALQQLMPQAAFLRLPPYPGVVCRYHGGYGFVVVMTGSLYREGDRPRERFRAMRYFHLGHRLEEIVIRERELRAHDKEQGSNHEATRSEQVDQPH